MSFDLHLEIAGLCLMVRRSNDLLVLLPKTHSGPHRHLPVLGSRAAYQPEWSPGSGLGRQVGDCIYHDLGTDDIRFDTDPEIPVLNPNVASLGVVDLPCGAGVDPGQAHVQISLPHGEPHAGGNRIPGVCWTRPWVTQNPVMQVSTLITWKVPELRNQVGGTAGLEIRVSSPRGQQYGVKLRPDGNDVVRMFLFHTLEDELPCATPGGEILTPGQEARHFHHYLSLLRPGHTCRAPRYYGRPDSTGRCRPHIIPPGGEIASGEGVTAPPSDWHGRRYSCLLATTEE